jgi:hydrogenase expression/formation protein HypE
MIINMAHGSGGAETSSLIEEIFMQYFRNDISRPMEDSAILDVSGGKLAFTTDSFVVDPLFFPGGDIGRLSVCGTVNDLLTSGAKPLYLSAGFILEEGLDTEVLRAICRTMAETAAEAGVSVVTGDTKVIGGSGGVYINTSGIGVIDGEPFSFKDAALGDALIVTGSLGDHHACILSCRMKLENTIKSDAAPLGGIALALKNAAVPIHGMRDITRGGLATILSEICAARGLAAVIREDALPLSEEVASFAKILGLDPLYMGNEGKLLIAVPAEHADAALIAVRKAPYGGGAVSVGSLEEGERPTLVTRLGGRRLLPPLRGEGLPRIC